MKTKVTATKNRPTKTATTNQQIHQSEYNQNCCQNGHCCGDTQATKDNCCGGNCCGHCH